MSVVLPLVNKDRNAISKSSMMKIKNNLAMDRDHIVALDIGTSKIAAIAGRVRDDATVEILAVGMTPSQGLKKGVIVNIEQAVESIQAAIKEVEIMAEIPVSSVCVGVTGDHIKSLNGDGVAPIKDDEVTQYDVDRAIETAQAIQLPVDQTILHVLPRDFRIDDQQDIKDPIGMSGYRLHANVHIVTGGVHPIENIKKCVKRCGLEVVDIVLEQIASSLSVLIDDERELGVCLVDIGGGTSDIAVFDKGAAVYTSVIPIGGDHVTHDVTVTLRTPTKNAEEIKLQYGCALESLARENETVEVPGVAGRLASRSERRLLVKVIEMRYEELFEFVVRELKRNGLEQIPVTGIVLTGGGSKIEGVTELAEKVFNAPVRIGRPQQEKIIGLTEVINNPIHATGVGLLLYVNGLLEQHKMIDEGTGIGKAWHKLSNWVSQNF